MEKEKPIKWGFIGCGSVTEIKSGPAYQKTDGFEVVAVMRRNEEKAADYAKRHQIKTYYTNADDLINDPNVDAVYIATPPDSHKQYALKVAAAGKPCCVEKPLSPSYADSKAIVAAFSEKQLPLFVAYYRRSLPRFLKVDEWLKNNKIGVVRHINWVLTKPASDWDKTGHLNWRTQAEVAPGGYFDDLASHGLDLFDFLLGEITTVKGISLNQQNNYTSKDAITAVWAHKNGVTGSGTWNFGADRREDKVEIYGSEGKITFSVFNEEDVLLENQSGFQKMFIEHPKHVQTFHVKNIQKHLNSSVKHPSTGKSALRTSWVMDNILENL